MLSPRDGLPSVAPTGTEEQPDAGDDGNVKTAVLDIVGAVVSAVGRAGSVSLSTLGDAVEAPGRALSGRISATVLSRPKAVPDVDALAGALGEQPRSPLLGGATGAALATKVAGRIGPLRFLARRTPLWFAITAVPAVHASMTRGAEELALVASHLVHRARAAGLEPDPERVRRVAVQLVSGAVVNPDAEPRYAPLALAWLRRALRATLPFSPGVATRNPGILARAAAAVDPSTLSAPSLPPMPTLPAGES